MSTQSTYQYTSEAHAQADRDLAGRFAKGNKGGPGNPFSRQVANIRKVLLNTIEPERIARIGNKLATLAEEGSVAAAKLLFSYLMGKPQPAPDPDRLDIEEWKIFRETTEMKQEAPAFSSAGTPEFHLNIVRTMRPIIAELMRLETENHVKAHVEKSRETPEQREKREAAEAAEAERILSSPAPELPPELEERICPTPKPAASPSANGKPSRAHAPMPEPSTNGRFHVT